ncbi:MAG: HIT family protein [Sphingomonadaceae bacterium]|nr:HIT family protein [Sphingomonadaceae bacterium]
MSLDGSYDEANVFAKILRGELPSTRIYEDDKTLAFLDLFPQSLGHSLIVSKDSKARNILEIEDQALCAVIATTKKVAAALRKALTPDGLVVAQANGAPAGQTVYHLHFHVIPRWTSAPTTHAFGTLGAPGKMADPDQQAKLAETIRDCF